MSDSSRDRKPTGKKRFDYQAPTLREEAEPVAEPASTGEQPEPTSDNVEWIDVPCPKCFAESGRKCYYVNRGGNFTFLDMPHKERIASISRPSEPSAPQCPECKTQLRDETAWYSCDTCHARYSSSMERGLYRLPNDRFAAPQTSAEPKKPFSCPIEIQCDHAERCLDRCQEGFVGFSMSPAAPQPVSGDAPEQWRQLPVGHWFFLDSPICTNRYSVQERTDSGCTLVCSTPWHHDGAKTDMQRIADLHNSQEAEPVPSPTPSVSTPQGYHSSEPTELHRQVNIAKQNGARWIQVAVKDLEPLLAAPSVAGTQPTQYAKLFARIEEAVTCVKGTPGGACRCCIDSLYYEYEKLFPDAAGRADSGAAQGAPQVEEVASQEIVDWLWGKEPTLSKQHAQKQIAAIIWRYSHLAGAPAQPGPQEKR